MRRTATNLHKHLRYEPSTCYTSRVYGSRNNSPPQTKATPQKQVIATEVWLITRLDHIVAQLTLIAEKYYQGFIKTLVPSSSITHRINTLTTNCEQQYERERGRGGRKI